MIEVRNIQKSFDGRTVIDGVSSVMKTGQCNLIIGASGSGKTVLMKCMVGLFEPDEGEVLYDGKNFTTMNSREKTEIRKEIGMLLPVVFGGLPVTVVFALFPAFYGLTVITP